MDPELALFVLIASGLSVCALVAVTLVFVFDAVAGKVACQREHSVYDCVRVYVPEEDVE
jgi:hypothetical protein